MFLTLNGRPITLNNTHRRTKNTQQKHSEPPAALPTVERLFSRVGIAFGDKRQSADASTLRDIAFAQANLP
jgi:hypothetical protein